MYVVYDKLKEEKHARPRNGDDLWSKALYVVRN